MFPLLIAGIFETYYHRRVTVDIIATFDPEFDAGIRKLWSAMRRKGLGEDLGATGVPPHLTLCRGTVSDSGLGALVEDIGRIFPGSTAGKPPISLEFPSLGIFWRGQKVVHLEPAGTPELFLLQEELAASMRGQDGTDDSGERFYRKGTWKPHVSVATNLPAKKVASALELAMRTGAPECGSILTLVLATYPPYRPLASFSSTCGSG